MTSPVIQPSIKLIGVVFPKVILEFSGQNDQIMIENLKLGIGFGIGVSDEDKTKFAVNYEINLTNQDLGFRCEIKAFAFFEYSKEVTEEELNVPLIQINAPAIGFPFIRSFLSTVSLNAGLSPIILPSFNFEGDL